MRWMRWLLAVGLVLMFATVGCQPQQPAEEEPEAAEETVPEETAPETAEATITVDSPVPVEGQAVTIASVEATAPGWLVIHADENGSPGADMGASQVQAGLNQDIVVNLDTPPTTDRLWAMLHLDTGQVGTYEFPNGDPPVVVNGQPLVVPFDIQR